jgi:hypothetical protein
MSHPIKIYRREKAKSTVKNIDSVTYLRNLNFKIVLCIIN